MVGVMALIGRRGDLRDSTDRLDPVAVPLCVHKAVCRFRWRSSSAKQKRAGQLQNLVGVAQFPDLPLQRLDALAFFSAHALPCAAVDLLALDRVQQGLRRAADLGRDGYRRRPQRWVLPAMLLNQAPGVPPSLLPPVKTDSSLSWLHLLKVGSLLITRGGSFTVTLERQHPAWHKAGWASSRCT